ncbi:Ubiquitin domain-containing protein DSK2 [Diplonema papillatum]|nr:Ubiquitin domain-containing protein DSK2 [Diplonema papillatum]
MIEIVLKMNAKTVNITGVDEAWTIAELKKRVETETEVPAECQRIVHKGRLLKDDQTVEGSGIQDGNAVHMVRGAKRASDGGSAEPTSSTSAAPATTTTAPATTTPAPTANAGSNPAANNPFAAMFGAGGMPDMGAMGGMGGGMGGMGSMADMTPERMQQTMQLMQNPMMRQMMTQMMQQPGFMESMAQHPMLQNMPPHVRAQMANPQAMQQMLQMMDTMGGNQGATGGAQGQPGAAAGQPAMNPFLMSMMAGGNAGNAGSGLTGGATPAQTDSRPLRERYAEQLAQMREMGFPNEEANIAMLQQCGGNVSIAIDRLLSS